MSFRRRFIQDVNDLPELLICPNLVRDFASQCLTLPEEYVTVDNRRWLLVQRHPHPFSHKGGAGYMVDRGFVTFFHDHNHIDYGRISREQIGVYTLLTILHAYEWYLNESGVFVEDIDVRSIFG